MDTLCTRQVSLHDRWPLVRGTFGRGAPNVIHLVLYASPQAIFILNAMSCIAVIIYAIVIERKINASYSSRGILYSTRTLVFNISQLLAFHIILFHIRLYTMHSIQPVQHLHSLVQTRNRSFLRHRGLNTEDMTFTT